MSTEETDELHRLDDILKKRGLKLALAESCTGGLMGYKITSIPGSSEYFTGSIISYANSAKVDLLGISKELLDDYGAVSKECAEKMAKGVRERLYSDIGVAITGVAGPTGGTSSTPVGTVFITIMNAKGSVTAKLLLYGSREEIREQAASMAIKLLLKELRSEPS